MLVCRGLKGQDRAGAECRLMTTVVGRELKLWLLATGTRRKKDNQVKGCMKCAIAIPAAGERALGQLGWKNEDGGSCHYLRAWCHPQFFPLLSVPYPNTFLLC